MTRKQFYLLPFIHLITLLHLNAQEGNTLNTSSYFSTPLIGKRYLPPPPNGEGSPFLFNGIVNGEIIVTTGDTVKNKLLKFDGLRNELIWINDQSEFVSLDSSYIKAFTLYPNQNDIPHHFVKIPIKLPFKPDSTNYYLEILNDTVFLAYVYQYVEIIKEQSVIDGVLRQTNIFKPLTTYFIKFKDRPIKQIALSRRSLINAYPPYEKEIKKVLNKFKIRVIKTEQQLKEAIQILSKELNLSD